MDRTIHCATHYLVWVGIILCQASLGTSQAIEQNPDGQCALLNQLQSSVIQILSTHYEYGEGIHTLHNLVYDLDINLKDAKDRLKSLEGTVKDLETLIPQADVKDEKVNTSLPLLLKTSAKQRHHHNDYKTKMSSMLDIISVINNLTQQLHEQENKYKRLSGKVNGVRRSIKAMQSRGNKESQKVDKDTLHMMEHFMNKQSDINGEMQNRLSDLEMVEKERLLNDSPTENLLEKGCPNGFIRHALSCYKFENITKNWIDAEKHCQNLHPQSHLVGIETKDEQDFIRMYRRYNNAHWSNVWMWTGGSNMAAIGRWTWVGTGRDFTYINWMPRSPDSKDKEYHCVYFSPENDSQWDDWHCKAAQLNFLCEITL